MGDWGIINGGPSSAAAWEWPIEARMIEIFVGIVSSSYRVYGGFIGLMSVYRALQ